MVEWRQFSIFHLGIHYNPIEKTHNWVSLIVRVFGLEIRWDVHDIYATVHVQYGDWTKWGKKEPKTLDSWKEHFRKLYICPLCNHVGEPTNHSFHSKEELILL